AIAEKLPTLVHGEEECRKVVDAALALFGRADLTDLDARTLEAARSQVPTVETGRPLDRAPNIADLFTQSGLPPSKSAARRAIKEGGAYVNNVKVTDEEARLSTADLLAGRFVVLRRGKRNLGGVILKG